MNTSRMNRLKELGRVDIRLSIRLWGILAAHDFDMGKVGL